MLLSKPVKEEVLYLYLAVSPYAISSALISKEEMIQWPVYYVSERLLDTEIRYDELEKLTYTQVRTSRKLQPYFLGPLYWGTN